MARFERRVKVENRIPTASMADIAFLLLIFFMSTTIFRMEEGLPITLPRAQTVAKQEREQLMRVWIDRSGRISIQDRLVEASQVGNIVSKALKANPMLIVAFNADRRTPSRFVTEVIEQLKRANAVRLSFTSEKDES